MLLAEPLTDRVIGLAIAVHPRVKPGDHTGPGLLEPVYDLCLCRKLADAGIAFARQVTIPALYKGAEAGAAIARPHAPSRRRNCAAPGKASNPEPQMHTDAHRWAEVRQALSQPEP
jgi:PD-(D/E)XK nuclease superfamily